jgi:teichuronic acid biosynthesis glycosyltransferase TuaC
MRILFFSTAFPQPQDPHRAPYNLQRCRALAMSHEVAVVSPRSWLDSITTARPSVRAAPGFKDCFWDVIHPTFYYPPGCFHGHHARCLWLSCHQDLSSLIDRFRPDVVLSYWTFPDGEVASRIARQARVPVVAIVGGSDVLLTGHDGARRQRVRRVLADVDAIIAVSETLRDRIQELGVDRGLIHVIPPAVEHETFRPGDRFQARIRLGLPATSPVLLWVGRMAPVKSVATLIDAVAALRRTRPAVRLCLVGDGPLRQQLESQAIRSGLGEHTRFAGFVAPANLPDWYRAADVTVLPSVSEGAPNVLLESIACGTPFVASDVGDVRAIATVGLDVLVPPLNVESLTSALDQVLRQRQRGPRPNGLPRSWADCAQVIAGVLRHAIRTAA